MDKTATQQLRPLITNPAWEKMEAYLAAERNRLVSQLCRCTADELRDLQGQVKALDRLLALKQNLLAEEGRR